MLKASSYPNDFTFIFIESLKTKGAIYSFWSYFIVFCEKNIIRSDRFECLILFKDNGTEPYWDPKGSCIAFILFYFI